MKRSFITSGPERRKENNIALPNILIYLRCHFPICILGQVWCPIVSIPDICPLSYFHSLWDKKNTKIKLDFCIKVVIDDYIRVTIFVKTVIYNVCTCIYVCIYAVCLKRISFIVCIFCGSRPRNCTT